MALTFKIDASAGNIWTARLSDNGQLIDLPTMAIYINHHTHGTDSFTLATHTELRGNMAVLKHTGHAAVQPRSATDGAGTGASFATALPILANRQHNHVNSTLAASGTTATTARTAKTDDQVFFVSDGEVTCDLICTEAGANCECPYVLYGEYDDHTHTLAGNFAIFTYAPIAIADRGNTAKKFFSVATDGAGTGALWDEAQTHGYGTSAEHFHAAVGLSLAAYAAPAGSTGDRGGAKSWWVTHANGHVFVTHDVNEIGLEAFYDDLYSHVHTPAGNSSSFGPTYAQVFSKNNGDSYRYFQTGITTYEEITVESLAHNHTLLMS